MMQTLLSRMPARIMFIAAVTLAVSCLVGCTGSTSQAPAPTTPGVAGGAFDLPAPQSIARHADYVNSDRLIQAYKYEDIGGGSDDRVEPSGTFATFMPEYSGAQPLYITDAARAAYRFDVPGFTGPSEINLKWITPGPLAKNLWIGMANWDKDRWDWFQGTNKRIVVDSLEQYQSATNGILVAVVLLGSGIGDLAGLDWIRLGPELWRIEAVSTGGDVGMYSNIAVDADDLPHIACYDASGKNLMYYHQQANGTWTGTVVDAVGDVGLYPSIAIRPSGGPAIAYIDATNDKLKLATYWDSAWQKTLVDSTAIGVWSPSLQYDSHDYPHLAYFKLNHTLGYAVYDVIGFDYTAVDPDNASPNGSISLRLDGSDNPYIAYTTFDGVNYAWLSGSTWYKDVVVGGNLVLTTNQALSFSMYDKPGIAAFDGAASTAKYIYKSAGTWHITDIPIDAPAGTSMSSAQSASGTVHIACYANNRLAYASRQLDTWNPVTIDDSGWTGLYTSIALDSENFVHISYYDGTNKRLMYARYIDP